MKIALIGDGKTGGRLKEFVDGDRLIGPFNRKNPPTRENLAAADVAVIFVPGEAVKQLVPLLLESALPVVWGSTGHQWSSTIDQELKDRKLAWIWGENFSLGIALMKKLISTLREYEDLLPEGTFHLSDLHHASKKDAPSGTALGLKKHLERPVEITSLREDDVVGTHTLTLKTPQEQISLQHVAKDRSLFAKGAILAANKIHQCPPGLHHFSEIIT